MNFERTRVNDLEYIRRTRGAKNCRSTFLRMAETQRQKALALINDSGLMFATFFILRDEIIKMNLREELNDRGKTAMEICDIILGDKSGLPSYDRRIDEEIGNVRETLLWIFGTGIRDDGLNEDFDQILDNAAAVLIKDHCESSVLPDVIKLIFERNRKGRYFHDIAWVCFQTRDVNALRFIAGYLRSGNPKDRALARSLLNLPEDIPLRTVQDRERRYLEYIEWLRENDPYIYFTGESFQFSNSPILCSVDLNAKYLCKDCAECMRKRPIELTEEERSKISEFFSLTDEEKAELARTSQKLYKENPSLWEQWIHYPVDEQIYTSRLGSGGERV